MRTKFLLLFLTIAALAVVGKAQSVVLTAKKVTYTRPKPIADYKKTFSITYPKIKAKTPALSKKIEAILSYEKNFDFTIKEEQTEIQWLELAEYDVDYNANGILSIRLFIEGSGAYPSGSTRYLVVDTVKGVKATPATAFTNIPKLLAMVTKAKDEEVAKTIIELNKDPENKDADVEGLFENAEEYHKVSLDQFTVLEEGITFHHNYGFPHVVQALQPSGEFFYTWEEMKTYIKAGGLLSRVGR